MWESPKESHLVIIRVCICDVSGTAYSVGAKSTKPLHQCRGPTDRRDEAKKIATWESETVCFFLNRIDSVKGSIGLHQ